MRTRIFFLLLIASAAHAQKTTITLKSMTVFGPVVGSEPTIGRVDYTGTPDLRQAITLTSSDPRVVNPANIKVIAGQGYDDLAIKTEPVAEKMSITLTAHAAGSPDVRATFDVIPPSLNILDCQPKSLPGGSHATCKAWMNGVVASGATPQLSLTSSNNQIAAPATSTVTVPSGNRWVTFDVVAGDLPQSAHATISASYNGVTKTSDVTVTPAAIQAFGCAVAPASSSEAPENRPGAAQCSVVGGNFLPGQGATKATVGFVVHLTAPAPSPGYKIAMNFTAADPNLPFQMYETLTVPTGKKSAFFPLQTSPVEAEANVKVSATDPISKTVYLTQITVRPPSIRSVSFLYAYPSSSTPPSVTGLPLGGKDFPVWVTFTTTPPRHGIAYDVTYSGTTDIKGPARVRIDPSDNSYAGSFNVKVFPCAINPPCTVSATVGGDTAKLIVKP